MRVADTSVLYALFVEADAHHKRALQELGSPEPVVVPAEVLNEALGLLQLRHGSAFARAAAAALRRLPNVEVQPTRDDPWDNLHGEAWGVFGLDDPNLSFTDAVVVAWCRLRRLRPLSFDRRLLAAATS